MDEEGERKREREQSELDRERRAGGESRGRTDVAA